MALQMIGTGSTYPLDRLPDWRRMVESQVSFFKIKEATEAVRPLDVRLAHEHLENIRNVFNPTMAELAGIFGVSRQAIYKWLGKDADPEPDKLEKISALSRAADAFRKEEIMRASSLARMKLFDGQSLMMLVAAGEITETHIQELISEAKIMDAAYQHSKLPQSKAKPTEDWQANSIPGSPI